jgi:hypothetical protein
MSLLSRFIRTRPLTSNQLHKMAEEFRLPKRLLSEAQEVLLHKGYKPKDANEILRRHCTVIRANATGVAGFRALLDETLIDYVEKGP